MATVSIDGPMVAFIKATGIKIKFLDMENIFGTMVGRIKDIGLKIICTVKEYINGLTEESTKETTLTTKNMDMVSILILTVPNIKVSSEMMSKKDMEKKSGLMELSTLVHTKME